MKVKQTEFAIVRRPLKTTLKDQNFLTQKIKGKVTEDSLRLAYRGIFNKAKKAKSGKVVFLPVGIDEGFPEIGTAKIVSQEILRFCRAYPGVIRQMMLHIDDAQTHKLFEQHVYGYLRHVQEDLGCGPYVTVDILIELKEGLVVIERTNPPFGYALPGGFVDSGESVEDAAIREAKEETNLDLENLRQFHVYSDPRRDPRFHTVSTAFIANGKGQAKSGDDAKGLKIVPYQDLLSYQFAFDHGDIIRDYLKARG